METNTKKLNKGIGTMKRELAINLRYYLVLLTILSIAVVVSNTSANAQKLNKKAKTAMARMAKVDTEVRYKTIKIDKQDIFYREAGDPTKPKILLLHGFPTSSHMFRNLMPKLAKDFYVVAPDYPGFGHSSMPKVTEFDYTFENLSNIVEKFTKKVGFDTYSIYLMDYGAPIGYRIAERNPKRIQALIIQNGNAYEEGLRKFWDPIKAYWKDQSSENEKALRGFLVESTTKWQYTHGTRNPNGISPDNWIIDQYLLDREGNKDIQVKLFLDYGTNPPLYPKWQAYFRKHQPPALIVWGKNDYIFPKEGAEPYKRDLKNLEYHLLDTGHFALEEDSETIGKLMIKFLKRQRTK